MVFLYIFCFESQERCFFSRFSMFSVFCSISVIFSCFPYRENLPLYCIPLNHLLLVFSSAIGLYVTPQNALWIGAKKNRLNLDLDRRVTLEPIFELLGRDHLTRLPRCCFPAAQRLWRLCSHVHLSHHT